MLVSALRSSHRWVRPVQPLVALRGISQSAKVQAFGRPTTPARQPSATRANRASSNIEDMFAETTAAELHDLPNSVKSAGKPSSSSTKPRYTASGNSASAADISSRPAGPGPSAPRTSASKAAPNVSKSSSIGKKGPIHEAEMETPGVDLDSSKSGSGEATGENWNVSFSGMAAEPFSPETNARLMAPLNKLDVEIKPDGIVYLPEIKYRKILNEAFGPGAWGMAPRSETNINGRQVSREWALICNGRFVATARGEQDYFDPDKIATATEGCKSNALMRCCKDLGIASELWDPRWTREFKKEHCVEIWAEHATTKKKKKLWRRKDGAPFGYPYSEGKKET